MKEDDNRAQKGAEKILRGRGFKKGSHLGPEIK